MLSMRILRFLLVVMLACGGTDAPRPTPPATPTPQTLASASPPLADCAAAASRANVDEMTNAYVTGCSDDNARKDLIKQLSQLHDPRTSPALAKAFNGYQLGKTDEDVKYGAESVVAMVKEGVQLDKSVVDALWACFINYRPSKTNSIQARRRCTTRSLP
jgi:hypothetical protein